MAALVALSFRSTRHKRRPFPPKLSRSYGSACLIRLTMIITDMLRFEIKLFIVLRSIDHAIFSPLGALALV
jgi:hypothetical protein